ncbi:globin-coupled sensor protein [Acetobacter sp.]|jgi:methyl-accepting chemotaxis protein|uniref:globin-coupled sensor protein n=1 Tax=Acetobacter sp. TaxID=440 RepID=UPI0025C4CFFA|nr:globin-coupled sensor protein [Acetobacter sp.]MCH4090778.1 globin-coupled sensor protein [Acetobacter sp.]MCI1300506.1 globin-coupled sensor protein [Acetobacter sp.]MCI1316292.1 globin-coupled sensor protein [Acetobacter sp.]
MTSDHKVLDIDSRLSFLGLGKAELDQLEGLVGVISRALPRALNDFYIRISETPEVAHFFTSEEQKADASSKQYQHWRKIVTGRFGADYFRDVERIGVTHARIGLDPRWYIAGNSLIIEYIVEAIVQEDWPKVVGGGFVRKPRITGNEKKLARDLGLLVKATMLDMELAVTSALNELEKQRKMAKQEQEEALEMLAIALERVAEGNLVQSVDAKLWEKSPRLGSAFEKLLNGLGGLISSVRETAEKVESDGRAVGEASRKVAQQMTVQVSGLDTIVHTIEDVTVSVKKVADQTVNADKAVKSCCKEAERGQEIVSDASVAITKISVSSGQISQIIGMIDEIALQTNLLALNAGVEAARAGDAGKGFGVVAQEVRALAGRSADAAKQIKSLVSLSVRDVEEGVKLAGAAGSAIGNTRSSVESVGGLIGQIAEASATQATRVDEISRDTLRLAQDTKRSASVLHNTIKIGQELEVSSSQLLQLVTNFKLRNSANEHTSALSAVEWS